MDPTPPTRLATTIAAVQGNHTVTLDRVVAPEQLSSLPANIKPTTNIPVTVTINDARPAQLFLRLAITVLPGLLIVAALWQLWGLLRSARHGDPFTTANVWRLRQFGWLLLLGWPLVAYLTMALKEALATTVPANDTAGLFAPPIGGALIFGLAVLVLAEVFAHGLRLREDVDGTI